MGKGESAGGVALCGKWQCVEGQELVPRSHTEPQTGDKGEGMGCICGCKAVVEKETKLKSCRGCECNRGLGLYHLPIFMCVWGFANTICFFGGAAHASV